MVEDKLNQDLKQALLSKDELRVSTLRSIKNALLYAKVAQGSRDATMSDAMVTGILQKEAKKRQESAELFASGGATAKAQRELAEKAIIEEYLPKQLTGEEIARIVDEVIVTHGSTNVNLGELIRGVKERTAGAADGAAIARIAKERLSA